MINAIINVVNRTNTQIAEKQFNIYGSLPKICFFRDAFPIIYAGTWKA